LVEGVSFSRKTEESIDSVCSRPRRARMSVPACRRESRQLRRTFRPHRGTLTVMRELANIAAGKRWPYAPSLNDRHLMAIIPFFCVGAVAAHGMRLYNGFNLTIVHFFFSARLSLRWSILIRFARDVLGPAGNFFSVWRRLLSPALLFRGSENRSLMTVQQRQNLREPARQSFDLKSPPQAPEQVPFLFD
jgi:hypothetical protein